MKIGDRWSSGLRPDGQAFDAVQITTIPRYKTSDLSGNEWRVSAHVRLYRKGEVVAERSYGDVESAAKFLSCFMVETCENEGGNFGSIEGYCDQEGCSEPATIFYQKKKDWCGRCGVDKEINYAKVYRKFCSKHKTRGDCGLDDCDSNYILLPKKPTQGE